MQNVQILWADDEIDLLLPHQLFLKAKGYDVTPVNNGASAIELVQKQLFDIVFLDENMPGLTGLETLVKIKQYKPHLPIVMITKSEEENIMEDAIGAKITDYLIKPVNPTQLLLCLKKHLDGKRILEEKTTSNYMQDFRAIGTSLSDKMDHAEWTELYKKLVYWDIEVHSNADSSMSEVFYNQKTEANNQFFKFVERNYLSWLNGTTDDKPDMSHTVFKNRIAPLIDKGEPVVVFMIDNLRLDQWQVIAPYINELFNIQSDSSYYSILPTATQYARNAFFSGLMPSEMEKKYPTWWVNDEADDAKNAHEADFLGEQLKRLGKNVKYNYTKVTNIDAGKRMVDNMKHYKDYALSVVVYNFVDMLSHARTDMEIIRELADNEVSYRSVTKSWFEHSPLFEAIKFLGDKNVKVVLTTDHGTVHVKDPSKIVGDRNVNTNLRYKQGKALAYEAKDVFLIKNPADGFLPRQHPSSSFVFAKTNCFFAYPNNYAHYVNYYKNTFQHGGVSLEEVIIPFVVLGKK